MEIHVGFMRGDGSAECLMRVSSLEGRDKLGERTSQKRESVRREASDREKAIMREERQEEESTEGERP